MCHDPIRISSLIQSFEKYKLSEIKILFLNLKKWLKSYDISRLNEISRMMKRVRLMVLISKLVSCFSKSIGRITEKVVPFS